MDSKAEGGFGSIIDPPTLHPGAICSATPTDRFGELKRAELRAERNGVWSQWNERKGMEPGEGQEGRRVQSRIDGEREREKQAEPPPPRAEVGEAVPRAG